MTGDLKQQLEAARRMAGENPVMGVALLTAIIAKGDEAANGDDALTMAEVYMLRGQLLLGMGKQKEAAEDAEKAVQLNPDVAKGFTGSFQAEGKD